MWRGDADASPRLARQFARGGRTAFRPLPDLAQPLQPIDGWLLDQVTYCLLPTGKDIERLMESPAGREYIARGGTALAGQPDESVRATRLECYLGSNYARRSLPELYAELRAVTTWGKADYAFELRNIVSLLDLARHVAPGVPNAIDPREMTRLRDDVAVRVHDTTHREDFGSTIALCQTLYYMGGSKAELAETHSWLADGAGARSWDVKALVEAVGVAAGCATTGGLLTHLAETMGHGPFTQATYARSLDAVAFAARIESAAPRLVQDIAAGLTAAVDQLPRSEAGGWLSVESTADVARGLAALRRAGALEAAPRANIDALLAYAREVLLDALPRYERNAKGIAWRCRLVEAVIEIDLQVLPGIETLRDVAAEMDTRTGDSSTSGLMGHLTDANVRLRAQVEDLSGDAVAAWIGRFVANSLSLLVLVGVVGLVARALVSSSLVSVLPAAGAAVVVLVIVAVLLAATLDSSGLLYEPLQGPYRRARRWLLGRFEDSGGR